MPIVTIVIPLYNKENYIERAIKSILNQTITNFELIIVNDGSTDKSLEIVEAINDKRIRIITQKNMGPGYSRNVGIREAQSDLVAFLDADDEWLPNYLDVGIELLRKNPSCALVTQSYYVDSLENDKKSEYLTSGLQEGVTEIHRDVDIKQFSLMREFIYPWNTIFRKSSLLKYGGFFDKYKCLYGEDTFLELKILLNEKVYIHAESNVVHHKIASQLSNLNDSKKEIPPYLRYPEEIFSVCKVEFQPILKKELFIRAIETAKYYSKHGDGVISENILREFHIRGFMVIKYWRYMFYARIAPIIPFLLPIHHWLKNNLVKKII